MSASAQNKLLELIDKRLEKFVSLVPRVLVADRPDTIHDIRVYSRRLQQAVRVAFPAGAGSTRKLVRALRKARRGLGSCRNFDVTIELVQKRIRAAKDEATRDAWTELRHYLEEQRRRELLRARRELSDFDVVAFIERMRALLGSRDREKHPEALLKKTIAEAVADWYGALDNARHRQGPESFHAFRIAGKRLRYRLELLAATGDSSSRSKVKALKKLQDEIGQWHDRKVMLQLVADFIARPDFLADRPDLARSLLMAMDSERQRDDEAIASLLKSAERIRGAWTLTKVKRRAVKGNGLDKNVKPREHRAADD